jgi:hypothetical protein
MRRLPRRGQRLRSRPLPPARHPHASLARSGARRGPKRRQPRPPPRLPRPRGGTARLRKTGSSSPTWYRERSRVGFPLDIDVGEQVFLVEEAAPKRAAVAPREWNDSSHRASALGDHEDAPARFEIFASRRRPVRQRGFRITVDGCIEAQAQPQRGSGVIVIVALTFAAWNPGAVTWREYLPSITGP